MEHGHNHLSILMRHLTLTLPESLVTWVETQVATGRYADASDLLSDLIRVEQAHLDARDALARGPEAGQGSGPFKATVPGIGDGFKAKQGFDSALGANLDAGFLATRL
jgi:antitoxin ParD1/3/4